MSRQNEILDVGKARGTCRWTSGEARSDKVPDETWISERGLRVDTCSSRLGTALLEGFTQRCLPLMHTRFQPKSRGECVCLHGGYA